MLNLTLAIAVLSASSAFAPLANLPHLHPHMPQADSRVAVVLENNSLSFVDLKIDGHCYTVLSHHTLSVTAPVGTAIYAESTTYRMRPGQVIATLATDMNGNRISLR